MTSEKVLPKPKKGGGQGDLRAIRKVECGGGKKSFTHCFTETQTKKQRGPWVFGRENIKMEAMLVNGWRVKGGGSVLV